MNKKVLSKALILAFLVITFVAIESNTKSYASSVWTCSIKWDDWLTARDQYDAAFDGRFHNPVSCSSECTGASNQTACETNCENTRQGALSTAESVALTKAQATCAPNPQTDDCWTARQEMSVCDSRYNTTGVTDQAELDALFADYSRCREATKIDMCQ